MKGDAFAGDAVELLERLKRLRLIRRWDQATLGQRAGLSGTAISSIETGRVLPSPAQVEALADALGYSADFLVSRLGLGPTTRPWLRAYADASKKEADARLAAASIATEYVRRLQLKPLPDLTPRFVGDHADDGAIDEIADEVRQLAQIEEGAVVPNAVRAAERVGCVVLPLESELGRHVGMSVRSDDLPIVCVAKCGVPGDRQRFTVSHELGHLVLHGNAPPPRNADEAATMERQANHFAASFLTPGDSLIETLEAHGGKVMLRTLVELKATWGVAVKMLVGRFRALGVIDSDHATSLYRQISARRWTKEEPVHVPTESAQWLPRVLCQRAGLNDMTDSCRLLAAELGGNAVDLLNFADWSSASISPNVIPLRARRTQAR